MAVGSVTVGMVCYDEGAGLARALSSLVRQEPRHIIRPRFKELLLVQNGNCGKTLKAARSFQGRLPLSILKSPCNSIGLARKIIIEKSRSPLVAFMDGDSEAPPDWLASLLSHYESFGDAAPAALGGPNRLPEKALWQKAVNLSLESWIGHGFSPQAYIVRGEKARASHIPTCNGLFVREKVLEAGNFSPTAARAGEDLDLGRRMSALGCPLYMFPKPLMVNEHSKSFLETLRRLFRFGAAQRQGFRRFAIMLFLPLLAFLIAMALLAGGAATQAALLLLCLYAGLLACCGLVIALRQKKPLAFILPLMLPFIWLLSHAAYSLGALTAAPGLTLRRRQRG